MILPWLRSALKSQLRSALKSQSRRKARRAAPRRNQLESRQRTLEPLEGRLVPAVLALGITAVHDLTLQHNGPNYEIVETSNPANVLASQSDAVTSGVFVGGVNGIADILRIDHSTGTVSVPVVFIAGDGAGDQLTVQGASFANVTHELLSPGIGIGKINQFGKMVDYNGVETITDTLDTAVRTFQYPASDDAIDINPGALLSDGLTHLSSPTAGAAIDFVAPSAVLSIRGGAGNDSIHLNTVDFGSASPVVDLLGNEDNDSFIVAAGSSLPNSLNLFGDAGAANLANVHDTQVVNGLYGSQLSAILILDSTFNDAEGYGILLQDMGAVSLKSVTAASNDFGGLSVEHGDSVAIAGGSFSENRGDGISLTDISGAATLDGVIANKNIRPGRGLYVLGAGSVTDTDGTFSENENGGIVLQDITGDVTLVRTTADNNDANNDGFGDGLNVTSSGKHDTRTPDCENEREGEKCEDKLFAIGGNLLIQGSRFRDTGAPNDHQERGIFVNAIAGSATLESSGDLEMEVTNNELDGAVISHGTTATFHDGDYLLNGFKNIFVGDMSGNVALTGVTANQAGQYGLYAINVPTFSDVHGIYSHNADGGLVLLGISGDVTLVETTADDNDANHDSVGDGFQAVPGLSIGTPGLAIGGDLLVQGSRFRDNGRHGLYVESIAGAMTLQNALVGLDEFVAMEVAGNAGRGVYVLDGGTSAALTGGEYSKNETNVSLHSFSGGVTLNGVTVSNAEQIGLLISSANSVSDTDGTYNLNGDGGIVVYDIAGNVTLVRTTADDNDADGDKIGDGLTALAANQIVAIGGDLLVQGSRFRSSGLVSIEGTVGQVNGMYVESIAGSFEAKSSGLTTMEVTGNSDYGIFVNNGGTTATLYGGDYSHNGNNLFFQSLAGGIQLSDVTANHAKGFGLAVQNTTTLKDTFGTYSFNRDGGIVLQDITGNVTLVRTTADSNDTDANGDGDGFVAQAASQATAIGGDLLVQGGRFRNNHRGLYIPSIAGAVTLKDYVQKDSSHLAMEVTDNDSVGIALMQGGTKATLQGGDYSRNGGTANIYLDHFADPFAAVSFTDVTASDGAGRGVFVGTTDSFTDSGGTYSGNAAEGIALYGSKTVQLTNTTGDENGDRGLFYTSSLSDPLVTVHVIGSRFRNNGSTGLTLQWVGSAFVEDTEATGNQASGIGIEGGFDSSMAFITGGNYSHNGYDGVVLHNLPWDVILVDVTANSNGFDGISIVENVDQTLFDVIIDGATVVDNQYVGVNLVLGSGPRDIHIENSLISSNSIGIYADFGAVFVKNSEIISNTKTNSYFGQFGIGIAVHTYVEVTDSTLSNNMVAAQMMFDSSELHLHGNVIQGNSAFGVQNLSNSPIDAVLNYWGSASGPIHATNPGGTGDKVSNNVDFAPWAANSAGNAAVAPMIRNGNLIVGGTNSSDNVSVDLVGSNYVVTLNGQNYSFNKSLVTDHIVIYTFAGSDTVQVLASKASEIHGGDGDDTLTGGGAVDLIFGDAGNDTLWGGKDGDLLSGGLGVDALHGDAGNDILLGGTLKSGLAHNGPNGSEPYNAATLKAIAQAWSNSGTMDTDLSDLTGEVTDLEQDSLWGGTGADWFLGNITTGSSPHDIIFGLEVLKDKMTTY